jgi:hypothetical protein
MTEPGSGQKEPFPLADPAKISCCGGAGKYPLTIAA